MTTIASSSGCHRVAARGRAGCQRDGPVGAGRCGSVLVDVVAVHGVPVAVVHVVDVVAVRHCDVSAALAVNVLVTAVLGMVGRLALVDVPLVRAVQVTVVGIVDVVAVRECDVSAALAVDVLVAGVLDVSRRHDGARFLEIVMHVQTFEATASVVTPASRTPIETLGDAH